MNKETWLDARALGTGAWETLPNEVREAFDVLVASRASDAGLPGACRLAIDCSAELSEIEKADILVFRDPEQVREFSGHSAARAFETVIKRQADLHAIANIVRENAFDYLLVELEDATNIPLEFLIAWFQDQPVKILKRTNTVVDGKIAGGTLERGCDGLLLSSEDTREIAKAGSYLFEQKTESLETVEWTVTSARHVGMGHRVCVDTTSMLAEDEGMLVGTSCNAMILMCSETHDLPYMPLRPFRVNAGALHSYLLCPSNQTRYLSDLRSGDTVLGVDTSGRGRVLGVGRLKIERRPLRMIEFENDGQWGAAFVQDDWHVRIVGAGGEILNVTDCTAGTKLLGVRKDEARHCGIPIAEELVER